MATATSKQYDQEVKEALFGTVVSLNTRKHICTISLKNGREKRGFGILDTARLEDRLKGVNLFCLIGKTKRLNVTVIPLTQERSRELNIHPGKRWEVIRVRPQLAFKTEIPSVFKTPAGDGESYLPSINYCKQPLPPSARLKINGPKEKTAMIIHSFTRLLSKWHCFPLEEFYKVLQNREEFSDVINQFRSLSDIRHFLRAFPQYFSLVDNDTHLVFPLRFSEDNFKSFLAKQRPNDTYRGATDYDDCNVISNVSECKRQVRRLQMKAKEKHNLVLAIDCEGVDLGKVGPLTLLQIGTEEGEVFIFDVLATPDRADMFIKGGLKALLEDPTIIKVIHDCRSDQCALFFQFGVTLTNVFDTSVAYTTIWKQCHLFKKHVRPKLALLLEIFGLTAECKTDEFAELIHDEQLFGKRPLTREMLQYAADDVLCLVPVLYESLNKLISPLWRPHFEEKVKEALADSRINDPHEMYNKTTNKN